MASPNYIRHPRFSLRPWRAWGWPALAALGFIIADARLNGAERDTIPDDPPAAKSESQALEERIQKLIAQLGDPQYATRERAQSELKRLGLTAFDALYEAQNDEDIEISLRAQYLVRSLTVDWAHEDDPVEVKRILRGYSDKKEKQRKTLMDQLAKLPDWMGAEALARLARFERSPVLSKQAALLVMGLPFPEDSQRRDRLADRIEKTMELSKRPAALWMRTYARTLRDPATSLEDWSGVIAEEERMLDEFPGKTSRQLVLDLLRWHAEFLLKQDRKSEAEDAMRRAVALVQGAREQIIETVDWLMSHEAWSLVDEIAARYRDMFEKDPLLMYRLAEAQGKRGQKDLAEETARRAFEVPNENMVERYEWAYRLYQSRGLIDWAEREYRYIIEKEPMVSLTGLRARQRLAEMLHDYERDAEAAAVFQPLVEAMEKDQNVERGVAQAIREPGSLKSRMYYFLSEAARRQGNKAEQRKHLDKAIGYDPYEADVLIAMFQSGADDAEFHQKTRQLVDAASRTFREQIEQQRRQLDQIGNNDVLREQTEYFLAQFDNQYAWLVSNTFGDFPEALRLSHESLKLRPNTGAFLDTLAHCYAAVGDWENAVKHQTLAIEQEPHSSQIVRKLNHFAKELEKSKKKSSPR
jgi:hypothetical protein